LQTRRISEGPKQKPPNRRRRRRRRRRVLKKEKKTTSTTMHHIQGCEKKWTWEEYFLWQKLSRNNKIRTQIQPTNKQTNKGSASASSPAKQNNKFPDIEDTAPGQEEEEVEEEEKCLLELEREKLLAF
jgi:hypothetical protein